MCKPNRNELFVGDFRLYLSVFEVASFSSSVSSLLLLVSDMYMALSTWVVWNIV